MIKSLCIAFLVALTVAIPTPPPTSQAANFCIVANLASNSSLSAAQGWDLTSYHTSPCYDYAVFSNNTGRTFYANGTTEEFDTHKPDILSDGGTPSLPWGTVVAASNATDAQGRRNVYINCGAGTPGLEVANDPPRIVYGTGDFYVCNSTFLYGPAIALYFKEQGQATPQDCADVDLQPWCVNNGTEHETAKNSTCYSTTN